MTKAELAKKLAFLERRHADLRCAAVKMCQEWEGSRGALNNCGGHKVEEAIYSLDDTYKKLLAALAQPFVEIG